MKIRESGMPERHVWETFFDPLKILTTLGITAQMGDVAEFGCGYGIFTFPAAKTIRGTVYALDIEPDLIQAIREEAKRRNLKNINAILRDFMAEGSGLENESVEYVMLFNILHLEKPAVLLNEAKRILRQEGVVGIIHWNYDPSTPRGPSMPIRPKPEDCINWAQNVGFRSPNRYDFKPYHYGIVLKK
jgi:SAM-dependent methyltransferase